MHALEITETMLQMLIKKFDSKYQKDFRAFQDVLSTIYINKVQHNIN